MHTHTSRHHAARWKQQQEEEGGSSSEEGQSHTQPQHISTCTAPALSVSCSSKGRGDDKIHTNGSLTFPLLSCPRRVSSIASVSTLSGRKEGRCHRRRRYRFVHRLGGSPFLDVHRVFFERPSLLCDDHQLWCACINRTDSLTNRERVDPSPRHCNRRHCSCSRYRARCDDACRSNRRAPRVAAPAP